MPKPNSIETLYYKFKALVTEASNLHSVAFQDYDYHYSSALNDRVYKCVEMDLLLKINVAYKESTGWYGEIQLVFNDTSLFEDYPVEKYTITKKEEFFAIIEKYHRIYIANRRSKSYQFNYQLRNEKDDQIRDRLRGILDVILDQQNLDDITVNFAARASYGQLVRKTDMMILNFEKVKRGITFDILDPKKLIVRFNNEMGETKEYSTTLAKMRKNLSISDWFNQIDPAKVRLYNMEKYLESVSAEQNETTKETE